MSWRRHLHLILPAGISSLACLIFILLWIRSYHIEDGYEHAPQEGSREQVFHLFILDSGKGGLEVQTIAVKFIEDWSLRKYLPDRRTWVHDPHPDYPKAGFFGSQLDAESFWNRLGFYGYSVNIEDDPADPRWSFGDCKVVYLRGSGATIPYWLLTAIFSIYPGWVFSRFLMRFKRNGCCRVCGYDLRATPDRCPECGTESIAPKLNAR